MAAKRSAQIPLALRLGDAPSWLDFVPDDAAALRVLRRAARQIERSAILLSGAAATGKSHLVRATLAEAQQHGKTTAYLPLRSLAENAEAMLAAQASTDWLGIDDLDALAGQVDAEVALFALHNRQRDSGGSVVYASATPLESLCLSLPDLRSRLAQSVQLSLATPNDHQRREIVARRARQRGLNIDAAALDFLLARVGRDLHGLMDWIDRIDRESLAAQRRITVPFLRELLTRPA